MMLEFNESLIAFDLQAKDDKEVIVLLAGKMHEQGLVAAEYGAQTWKRELDHPTGLPTKPLQGRVYTFKKEMKKLPVCNEQDSHHCYSRDYMPSKVHF